MISVGAGNIGARVLLKSCPFGTPGTVLRVEGSKLAIRWHDLDFVGRHNPDSLIFADPFAPGARTGVNINPAPEG
jgi:hypothetical protein